MVLVFEEMEDFVDDVDDENEEAGTQGIYTPSSVAKAMPKTATDVENRPASAYVVMMLDTFFLTS